MYPNIRYYFYGQIKELKDLMIPELYNNKNLWDSFKYMLIHQRRMLMHRFEFFIMCCYLIRLFMTFLMLINEQWCPLYRWDYFAYHIHNNRDVFNQVFILLCCFVVLLVMTAKHCLIFSSDPIRCELLYDIIVRNQDQYRECYARTTLFQERLKKRRQQYYQRYRRLNNENGGKQYSTFNPFKKCKIYIQIWLESWIKMDRIDRKRFFQPNMRMKLFPNVSIKTRMQLLLYLFTQDLLSYFLHLVCVAWSFSLQIFIFSYYQEFIRSWLGYLSIFIESPIFFNHGIVSLQSALLFTFTATTVSFLWCSYLKHLNLKLLHIRQHSSGFYDRHHNRHDSPRSHEEETELDESFGVWHKRFTKRMGQILKEHHRLCGFVLKTNRDGLDQGLQYYVLFSIPMNVCFMCLLIFEDYSTAQQATFIYFAAAHAVLGLAPLLSLAYVNKLLHEPKKYIPPLLIHMNDVTNEDYGTKKTNNKRIVGNHFKLRIKLAFLFERLMKRHEFAFTFGYLGSVTYQVLFQGLFVYLAIFVLTIKFYMNFRNFD